MTHLALYLKFKATTAFCSDMPSHLVCGFKGSSFVFQQDNDPKHSTRQREGNVPVGKPFKATTLLS